MTECVTIAGWIADSVSIPVIMDGDTGHGGIMPCAAWCGSASVPALPGYASTTNQ